VYSVWGSERDSNGRFPRWVWRPLEATERLKQYVSFTLKKWDCINPLGFARPINPSLNHHSISLKRPPPTMSTHSLSLVCLWKAKSLFCLSAISLSIYQYMISNESFVSFLLSQNSAWSSYRHIGTPWKDFTETELSISMYRCSAS